MTPSEILSNPPDGKPEFNIAHPEPPFVDLYILEAPLEASNAA